MRFHSRCRACRKRKVLKKHPLEYRNPPKCGKCGNRLWTLDTWMMARNTKKMSCTCDGYHFIHREGSLGCKYNSDGTSKWPQPESIPEAHPLDAFF